MQEMQIYWQVETSIHMDLLQMPIKTVKEVTNQTSHGEKGKQESANPAALLKVSKKRETVQTQRCLKQSPALEPAEAV